VAPPYPGPGALPGGSRALPGEREYGEQAPWPYVSVARTSRLRALAVDLLIGLLAAAVLYLLGHALAIIVWRLGVMRGWWG
jgi:hypothetical protein